jgi:hypothetical protein
VEDATKSVAETHKLIDAKLDGLYRVMQQWNSSSEFGSQERPPRPFPNPPSPTTTTQNTLLTADELAYLKKQEAAGKILLHQDPSSSTHTVTTNNTASASLPFHMPEQNLTPTSTFIYT